MSSMVVQSVRVSLEISDKSYGDGSSRTVNLSGRYEEGGIPLEEMNTVVEDSLDLFLGTWKSLLAAKFAQSMIGGTELKEKIDHAVKRTADVKAYLRRPSGTDNQPVVPEQ